MSIALLAARARRNRPFNPLSRFVGGKQGFLYDPSDFTTQFQDTAGTIPVTTVGQTVKRINDKSGNGNYVIQSASTWTIQFDGVNYYWQTDGVYAFVSAAFAWGLDKATICFAYKSDIAQQNNKQIVSFGSPISTGEYGSWDLELTTGGMLAMRRGSGLNAFVYTKDLGTTPQVISAVFDLTGTTDPTETPFFRVDGASPSYSSNNTHDSGTGNFGTYTLSLGGLVGKFKGRIYTVMAVADISNSSQLSQIEQWCSTKSGVGLATQSAQAPVFLDTGTTSAGAGYTISSAFSRAAYTTAAKNVIVNYQSPAYNVSSTMVQLGVYVNGVFQQALTPPASTLQSQMLTLPAGTNRVEFVSGLQTSPSGQIPALGTFFVSAYADAPMTAISEAPVNRLLLYGDSITVGADSTVPTQSGWGILIRGYAAAYSSPFNVAWEAYGYRTLYRDYQNPGNLTAFVAQLVAYNPAKIWLAIGTNDYGIITWSAANFGAAYAAVLDAIHTALPSCLIYTQTPIVRTSEAANSFGNTLGDYRTAIASAQSTRTGFTAFVDGTTILTTADLDGTGVHPTTAGHAKYATFVRGVLGI